LGFFDKKSDHPLADLKSVQQMMQDLPKNDALKALQEISDWLESANNYADFRADHRWEIVRLLDESARPHVNKLVREYYAASVPSAFQEGRLWTALNIFYTHTLQAYHGLLNAHLNNDKGATAFKQHLPLIAIRGIQALMRKLKCTASHYEKVDPALWQQLAAFYAHAESQQYTDTAIKPYADSLDETTVRRRLLVTIMWFAPIFSRLSPARMHIADKLTEFWGAQFTLTTQMTATSVFYFDLAQPTMPNRVTAESLARTSTRFIGAGDVERQIEILYKSLEKEVVPEELLLGAPYSAEDVIEVVRNLANHWINPPPVRRNTRHQVKVKLGVVRGFSGIVTHVAADNVSSETSWEAEDISSTGFSCVLPAKGAEGIKIGSLIGIQPERMPHYGAGVVRRINRDELGNLHVGIEMFSNQLDYAPLRAQRDDANSALQALLLKSPNDREDQVRLLMGMDAFSMTRSLHTQHEGNDYLLIPVTLLEKGVDYELASYRRVTAEAAETEDAN